MSSLTFSFRWISRIVVVSGLLGWGACVLASDDLESLGTFKFHDFVLAPSYVTQQQPGRSGFFINDSWISVDWIKDEHIKGELVFGTVDPSQKVVWMSPDTEAVNLGLLEAWIQTRGDYGTLRVGRIPISDGFEGTFVDGFWLMPPSEARKLGWTFSRDLGMSYILQTGSWLTEFSAHNGGGNMDPDGRLWATARWQYYDTFEGNAALVTATEGSTTPESTMESLANSRDQFLFNPAEDAKIRYGSISLFHLWRRNYLNFEFVRGDIVQTDQHSNFMWGRADVSWNLGGDLNVLARYEPSQTDLSDTHTIRQTEGLGVLISSRDQLSSITLFAAHHEESYAKNDNDLLLQFRVNSTSLGH